MLEYETVMKSCLPGPCAMVEGPIVFIYSGCPGPGKNSWIPDGYIYAYVGVVWGVNVIRHIWHTWSVWEPFGRSIWFQRTCRNINPSWQIQVACAHQIKTSRLVRPLPVRGGPWVTWKKQCGGTSICPHMVLRFFKAPEGDGWINGTSPKDWPSSQVFTRGTMRGVLTSGDWTFTHTHTPS